MLLSSKDFINAATLLPITVSLTPKTAWSVALRSSIESISKTESLWLQPQNVLELSKLDAADKLSSSDACRIGTLYLIDIWLELWGKTPAEERSLTATLRTFGSTHPAILVGRLLHDLALGKVRTSKDVNEIASMAECRHLIVQLSPNVSTLKRPAGGRAGAIAS